VAFLLKYPSLSYPLAEEEEGGRRETKIHIAYFNSWNYLSSIGSGITFISFGVLTIR
jgi:hypothetical protein